MYHTRKNIPLPPPSLTHHTHAQKHVRRCWIVLTQPTYTDDFYHEPEHSYIAGPYTPLKANRTVAATKTIQNVHKAHPPSRRQPSAPSVSGPSVSGSSVSGSSVSGSSVSATSVSGSSVSGSSVSGSSVSGTSVSGSSVSAHPSRGHPSRAPPSRGHPSRQHPSWDIRLRGILESQIK